MNAPANIPADADKAKAIALAALDWQAEAEKNPRSLECWRAEHRVMLAIGNMGFDDVETATEDLASLIDEHFHFDVAADARPAESYVPQVAA